jgi:hypothetical protein
MAVKSLARSGLVTYSKYSSMHAGNTPILPGAYELLETQILANSTTDVVTFSSLNSTYGSTYQHLMFRINAKAASVNGNTAAAMRIYMNGIGGDGGGSSYATHLLRQINSSGQQSQAYSSTSYGYIGFSTAQFGNWVQLHRLASSTMLHYNLKVEAEFQCMD